MSVFISRMSSCETVVSPVAVATPGSSDFLRLLPRLINRSLTGGFCNGCAVATDVATGGSLASNPLYVWISCFNRTITFFNLSFSCFTESYSICNLAVSNSLSRFLVSLSTGGAAGVVTCEVCLAVGSRRWSRTHCFDDVIRWCVGTTCDASDGDPICLLYRCLLIKLVADGLFSLSSVSRVSRCGQLVIWGPLSELNHR